MDIDHIHFTSIASTNTWAKENSAIIANDRMTVVTADEQTAGRGRLGRKWISLKEKNLYASFCFTVAPSRKDIGNIAQIMALAVADTLEKFGVQPQLKWPNDIMIHGKKAGGILTETVLESERCIVIVGIGINLNLNQSELEQIDRPATSLMIETGKQIDPSTILKHLEEHFSELLNRFLKEGFRSFSDRYAERITLRYGDKVQFHDSVKKWEGTFSKINPDGSLLMKLNNGEDKTFYAGEIIEESAS